MNSIKQSPRINAEQDKAAIEKTVIDLTNFVNDLDDEEKRYVQEEFDNDEELEIYDLLMKEFLTPAEIFDLIGYM